MLRYKDGEQSLLFWQNQLNFAMWCATTGCGVDFANYLNDNGLIGSMFRFHVYYQTRRILFEMSVALSGDSNWNASNNDYNHNAYAQICQEVKVDVHTDWRVKLDVNLGLDRMYHWWVSWKKYKAMNAGTKYPKQDDWVLVFLLLFFFSQKSRLIILYMLIILSMKKLITVDSLYS